jgi:hypothetical protein
VISTGLQPAAARLLEKRPIIPQKKPAIMIYKEAINNSLLIIDEMISIAYNIPIFLYTMWKGEVKMNNGNQEGTTDHRI